MKHVLVTGASGFIGRHLVERLIREGVEVRVLLRDPAQRPIWFHGVELVEGDLRDRSAMKVAVSGCDTVFHLAGKAHALTEIQGDEASYRSVNVEGTRNLLEAALASGSRRFVFFSSVKAMGEENPACLDESSGPRPVTAYGCSKLEAERLVLEYGRRFGLHAVCLRLPLVYGPGNKGNIFRMIFAIDSGFFPPLFDTGNRRSLVHVINVVEAALLAATHAAADGQCYIVTDGEAYSTRQLYEMICGALGKHVSRWHVPIAVLRGLAILGDGVGRISGKRFVFDSGAMNKLAGSAWYSSQKISSELGYRPSTNFEESLPELIRWYRKVQE